MHNNQGKDGQLSPKVSICHWRWWVSLGKKRFPLEKESANSDPWCKSRSLSVYLNEVLLVHSPHHWFRCCLWLLSRGRVEKLHLGLHTLQSHKYLLCSSWQEKFVTLRLEQPVVRTWNEKFIFILNKLTLVIEFIISFHLWTWAKPQSY